MITISIQSFVHESLTNTITSNSEAYASELRENLEDMLLRYYIGSNVIDKFKTPNTDWRVSRRERVKENVRPTSRSTTCIVMYVAMPNI